MTRDFLYSYLTSYKNAIDLINCYNNYLIGESLGDNDSAKKISVKMLDIIGVYGIIALSVG